MLHLCLFLSTDHLFFLYFYQSVLKKMSYPERELKHGKKYLRRRIQKLLLIALFFTYLPACVIAQNDYQLKRLSFHGNKKISDAELKSILSTQPNSFLERVNFWRRKPRFSLRNFKDDLIRIERLYQRNGFLTAQVQYRTQSNEDKKSLKIDLLIKEGDPVCINEIKIELQPMEAPLNLQADLENLINNHRKERFTDELVLTTETLLKKRLADKGFPFARVVSKIELLPGNLLANLTFLIATGDKVCFGKTAIQKDSLLPETFIRNRLKYTQGEVYAKKLVAESQQKLYDTDLFKYVVINTESDSLKNGLVPMSVHYRGKPFWTLRAGAGYGSEDRMRVFAEVTKRHFLGGARKLIFTGKSSYLLPVSLEARFIQPDFLINNLNLIENPYYIKQNEHSYQVERIGGSSAFQYNFSRSTNLYFSFSDEQVYFQLKKEDQQDQQDSIRYNKSGFSMGFNRNTTDDLFNPESGYHFTCYATIMGIGLDSRYHYLKLELDYKKYLRLPNNLVYAGRIRGGWIKPIMGDLSTPIEDRFMLGGNQSLRGWGRNQLSPVDTEGNYVGGNSMFESSSEIRFPLHKMVSGALFADVGNVWASSKIPDLLDLHMDLGAGLRYNLPIGPIRFDIATPIFEGKPQLKYFITIGHAF